MVRTIDHTYISVLIIAKLYPGLIQRNSSTCNCKTNRIFSIFHYNYVQLSF